jgi:hypothetical protein
VRSAAADQLGLTAEQIDTTLKAFSHAVGTPWRAPEKQAALAAWLALSPSSGEQRPRGKVGSRHATAPRSD